MSPDEPVHEPIAEAGLDTHWDAYMATLEGKALQEDCKPFLNKPPNGTPVRGTVLLFHGFISCSQQYIELSRLLAAGDLSRNPVEAFGQGASWHADVDELATGLASELREGVNVLVKGSRFMRMERVVETLCDPLAADTEA